MKLQDALKRGGYQARNHPKTEDADTSAGFGRSSFRRSPREMRSFSLSMWLSSLI